MDNHFQKAGFAKDRILECHGSIFHWQCNSCYEIFEAPKSNIPINLDKCEVNQLPECFNCHRPVRPNILMFGDYDWISDRTDE